MMYRDTVADRRTPIARSAFMRAEEIDRERAMSGWNPYEGEEETQEAQEKEIREQRKMKEEHRATDTEEIRNTRPCCRWRDLIHEEEELREEERDFMRLQSMYPECAKILMPYIEEECDKMEYEGSPMFDEYPDRTTVRRIQERVHNQVQSMLLPQEKDPQDLIRVMLLDEMYHRRGRRRSRRKSCFIVNDKSICRSL